MMAWASGVLLHGDLAVGNIPVLAVTGDWDIDETIEERTRRRLFLKEMLC